MNKAHIVGILSESFNNFDGDLYTAKIESERFSGVKDIIPIVVEKPDGFYPGQRIEVFGECKTFNDENNRLHVFIMVSEIHLSDSIDINSINIDGYICTKPIFRQTPLGRTITDSIIAVESTDESKNYIPCITWGKAARKTSRLNIGSKVVITGRFQSRQYQKRIEGNVLLQKTAYELSADSIDVA